MEDIIRRADINPVDTLLEMSDAWVILEDTGHVLHGKAIEFYRSPKSTLFKFIVSPKDIELCPPSTHGELVIKSYTDYEGWKRELEMTRILHPLQGVYLPHIYGPAIFDIKDDNNDTDSSSADSASTDSTTTDGISEDETALNDEDGSSDSDEYLFTIAMEFLQGMNLFDYAIDPDTDQSAGRVDAICEAILEAYKHATKLQVYHNDIRLCNIMFVPLHHGLVDGDRYTDKMKERGFRIVMIDFDLAIIRDRKRLRMSQAHNSGDARAVCTHFRAIVKESLAYPSDKTQPA